MLGHVYLNETKIYKLNISLTYIFNLLYKMDQFEIISHDLYYNLYECCETTHGTPIENYNTKKVIIPPRFSFWRS